MAPAWGEHGECEQGRAEQSNRRHEKFLFHILYRHAPPARRSAPKAFPTAPRTRASSSLVIQLCTKRTHALDRHWMTARAGSALGLE